eukprot:jgi/Orpsp1_1/1189773/evm.model.d7180000074359.1
MVNFIDCKLQCNYPTKKNGYFVYNLIIFDIENFKNIAISKPFSTMSHRQFFVRRDNSFIGKINDINTMKYYYDGF